MQFIPCVEHAPSRPVFTIGANLAVLEHPECFARVVTAHQILGGGDVAQLVAVRAMGRRQRSGISKPASRSGQTFHSESVDDSRRLHPDRRPCQCPVTLDGALVAAPLVLAVPSTRGAGGCPRGPAGPSAARRSDGAKGRGADGRGRPSAVDAEHTIYSGADNHRSFARRAVSTRRPRDFGLTMVAAVGRFRKRAARATCWCQGAPAAEAGVEGVG